MRTYLCYRWIKEYVYTMDLRHLDINQEPMKPIYVENNNSYQFMDRNACGSVNIAQK